MTSKIFGLKYLRIEDLKECYTRLEKWAECFGGILK